jgi:hypothetical protein
MHSPSDTHARLRGIARSRMLHTALAERYAGLPLAKSAPERVAASAAGAPAADRARMAARQA